MYIFYLLDELLFRFCLLSIVFYAVRFHSIFCLRSLSFSPFHCHILIRVSVVVVVDDAAAAAAVPFVFFSPSLLLIIYGFDDL